MRKLLARSLTQPYPASNGDLETLKMDSIRETSSGYTIIERLYAVQEIEG